MSDKKNVHHPGRLVALSSIGEGGEPIAAEVFPIGMTQIQEFSAQLNAIAAAVLPAIQSKVDDKAQQDAMMLQALGPAIISHGLSLVAACTKLSCDTYTMKQKKRGEGPPELPHWDVATVVDAWVDENFGTEEKLNPWRVVFKSVGSKIKQSATD